MKGYKSAKGRESDRMRKGLFLALFFILLPSTAPFVVSLQSHSIQSKKFRMRYAHHALAMKQGQNTVESIETSLMMKLNMQFIDNFRQIGTTRQFIVVLVGIPGSGKTSFSTKVVKNRRNWFRVCQDEMRNRQETIDAAISFLRRGKGEVQGVIIDRCNFDVVQRRHWVKIAKDMGAITLCVVLRGADNVRLCTKRASERGDDGVHTGEENWEQIVSRMGNQFVAPSLKEGFDAIYWCEERSGGSIEKVYELLVNEHNHK